MTFQGQFSPFLADQQSPCPSAGGPHGRVDGYSPLQCSEGPDKDQIKGHTCKVCRSHIVFIDYQEIIKALGFNSFHTMKTCPPETVLEKGMSVSPVAQLAKKEVGRETSTQPWEAAQDGEARQAGDGGAWVAPRPRNKEADDGCHGDEEEEEEERRRGRRGKKERGDKGGESLHETREHGCEESRRCRTPALYPRPTTLERSTFQCACVCVCVGQSTLALSASYRTGLVVKEMSACQQTPQKLCCFAPDSHVQNAVQKMSILIQQYVD